MEGPDGIVSSTDEIHKIAFECYKNLFKYESRPDIAINDNFFLDSDRVTDQENSLLEVPSTSEEIKNMSLNLMLMEPLDLMGFLSCSTNIFGIQSRVI